MGRTSPDDRHQNPFLSNSLAGWQPLHPNVRYPANFTTHKEGSGWGLYLSPVDFNLLHTALGLPDEQHALVLGGNKPPSQIPWSEINELEEGVDLVHLPRRLSVDELPELPAPLLANPATAVPIEHGSRAAVCLHDGCHGVVITRETDLLVRCLRHFISEYIRAVLGSTQGLPSLPSDRLEQLVQPLNIDQWYHLAFTAQKRFWFLDIELRTPESAALHERWVCNHDSTEWRHGWFW